MLDAWKSKYTWKDGMINKYLHFFPKKDWVTRWNSDILARIKSFRFKLEGFLHFEDVPVHELVSSPFSERLRWKHITLQRQNAENLKQIFPKEEYRGLSPNFHIHVPVSELYIPTMGLPFLLEEICGPILVIYKSLTDTYKCGNCGWGRAIPRKGI